MNAAPAALAAAATMTSGFLKRLYLGFLIVNLFVIVLAALALMHSRQQYQERAAVTTRNLAQVLHENIAASFAQIDLALLAVADEAARELAAGDQAARTLDAYATRQQRRQADISDLWVTDAGGGGSSGRSGW